LTSEDTLTAAEWFAADGLDFIEISGAFRKDLVRRKVTPGKGEGYYVPVARRFKERLSIPVIVVGGLRSLPVMNEALCSGACDAVSMSRPLICQPDFPQRLKRGEQSACIGCNLCLLRNDQMTACYAKNPGRKATRA
jgi:2,4-dienoyl-CoA reductase-like NADH-dependent reductase (Old Yellow Enzyme family)